MHIPGPIGTLLSTLRDFIYPDTCLHCGILLRDEESYLCTGCWNRVKSVRDDDQTVRTLRSRLRDSGAVDDMCSLFYFEEDNPIQSLVHALKYSGYTRIGLFLGERLGRMINEMHGPERYDVVIPVPLHRTKRRERGYNQSDFIAGGLARTLAIRVDTQVIARKKYTDSQTTMTVDQRRQNVASAFEVGNPDGLAGLGVLLVDDVITSGSTILETARVLRNAGAAHVGICSAALARLDGEVSV